MRDDPFAVVLRFPSAAQHSVTALHAVQCHEHQCHWRFVLDVYALLVFSGRMCCRHNMKLRSLLEHEAGAPPPAWAAAATTGLNDSDSAVSGAPLWELSLLTSHYHPHLSQAAAAVAHIPPQGVSLSALSFVTDCVRPSGMI